MATSKVTVGVWAAARDLASDGPLSEEDVAMVEVNLPGSVIDRYVLATTDIDGAILTASVGAGELIPASRLATELESETARAMSIPIEPEHAVGGDLGPGDRVDILSTFSSGDLRAKTIVLLRGALVLETVQTTSMALGDGQVIGLTISVSPEDAPRLAFAIRTGEIDVVKVSGSVGAGGTSTVGTGDF